MKTNTIDVNLYVKGDATQAIVGLIKLGGIVSARFNTRVKCLLDIQYDPDQTSSEKILNAVRQRGCRAALIGM